MANGAKDPGALAVPAAVARYGSILFQDRPAHEGDVFSRRHPRMPRLNRAKLFAPFAALAGFDDRVRRKEIAYVAKRELDADEVWELNHRLYALHRLTANAKLARANRVRVRVEYFAVCTDEENDACRAKGLYQTVAGVVVQVDPHGQCIVIRGGDGMHVIPFADLYRIFCPDRQAPPGRHYKSVSMHPDGWTSDGESDIIDPLAF